MLGQGARPNAVVPISGARRAAANAKQRRSTGLETNMTSGEQRMDTDQEWYYEFDGRAHGPLAWGELEELLARCGETAKEVRIRKGATGGWTPFLKPGASDASVSVDSIGAVVRRTKTLPRNSRRPKTLGEAWASSLMWLADNWVISAAVGIWLLTNAFLLWPRYVTERKCLVALEQIVAERQDLLAKPTSDRDWQDFADRSQKRLAVFVNTFHGSRHSDVARPLLYVCRDVAPQILGPASRQRDRQERRLRFCIDDLQKAIDGL